MKKLILCLFSVFCASFICADELENNELKESFELEKFMGEWLEIARKPAFFQKNCLSSKAIYTLEQGKIQIQNICKTTDNSEKIALGKGEIKENRKLAVSFGFFTNIFDKINYEIIYIDKDYQNALVASPNKGYFWLLSRKNLSPDESAKLLEIAKQKGVDISDIIFDKH